MAFGKTRTELEINLEPLGITMTAEELALEMRRWVAGEYDYHDLIIAEAKRLLLERFEQSRQTWQDLADPPRYPYQHQNLCLIYGLLQSTVKVDPGVMQVVNGQVVDSTNATR
jgi:hypothetical protein